MTHKSAGFIGGGRVTRILLGGLKRAGQLPGRVVVSDGNAEALSKLKAAFPEIAAASGDNRQAAAQDIVFLALPPAAIGGLLEEVKAGLTPTSILVSLAPKWSTAKLAEGLGGFQRIARMIPNAPSIVGAGYNPVAFSAGLAAADRAELAGLWSALGECPEVAEDKLEAYAILTAMGPTYLWFQLYELQAIGRSFGLTSQEVEAGIAAMTLGAVKTMAESGLAPEAVMDLVPSKPLGEDEATVKGLYRSKLEAMFKKLKG